MRTNIEQVRLFISLLTGDADSTVTWQVFYDPKNESQRPDLAKHWVANLDDSLEFLQWSQSQKCGVYVGINQSDGKGRENSNIVRYRAVFADFDGMDEPEWGLTPHFVQKRDDTHGHAFWLVSDITTADEFKLLQKRIAMSKGTDHQVTDPARVVRVAGFIHYKNPLAPAQYAITDDNTDGDFKYTKDDIIKAFPLTAEQDAKLTHWLESREGLLDGTGYELNERYLNQFSRWARDNAPVAILGNGSWTVFKVAAYAHDHGIPLPEAQEIMWEVYNPRCEPPWLDHDREQFNDIIERGYRLATSAAGCKTAIAAFSSTDAIPEPVDGWEANAKLKEQPLVTTTVAEATNSVAVDGRLTHEQASIGFAQLNEKSPHYDLAGAIDGILWNGCNLIRSEKIFYEFNGKVWSEVSDEVIRATVQRFFAKFKPKDSFVKGIFSVLCDMVNVPQSMVQMGTWLNDTYRDGNNVIVYDNGIVDLSDNNPTLKPHTRDFFTFNKCDYDYNPSATCPNWLGFLDSIWDNDNELKIQLQEFMGYLMTDSVELQKMGVFVGLSRGGKGVLTSVISKMIGESNMCAPALGSFNKDATKYIMSTKSVGLIPDAHSVNFNSRDGVLSELKAITGGDPVTYDVKFKSPQTKVLKIKFIISTNNVPEFEDSSGALANRMLVFPFNKSFVGREDPKLTSRLINEIEGINQWALEGLKRLQANGGKFTESQSGLIEKEEIREDMFPLAKYINAMCDVNENAKTATETLYSAYRLWCTMTGIKSPMTEVKFSKTLRNSGLSLIKCKLMLNGKEVRGFKGIQLSPDCMAKMTVGNLVNFPPVVNKG